MSWFLQIADSPPQSFTDLQCTNLKRELRSQTPGTFSFRLNLQAIETDPIAAAGVGVQVLWGNTPFFFGRVTKVPLAGSTAAEDQVYEISDAWCDFEQITFQQQWNRIVAVDESGNPTTAYQYSACCLLGIDVNGNAQTSGQVIYEAVTWAIARGAACQLGTIGVSSPVPVDEVTDLPVAEIIKKMLRFTPDAVAWFDFSATPPFFNVTRRAECTAVAAPFIESGDFVNITPRNDLVRTEVLLRYEQPNVSDGITSVDVTVDAAPGGADGLAFGALVSTVRLAGSNSVYQKQAIVSQAIPTDDSSGESGGPSDDPTIKWWRRKVAWLQQFSADRLSITNVYGVVDDGQDDPDGDGQPIEDDISFYPNELLSGNVAPWMNCYDGNTTWSAYVNYTYPDDMDDEAQQALGVFGPADGSDNASGQVYIYAHARATNAVTQTYSQLTSFESAEPVPTGLADELFGALNPLQYEGEWRVIQSEAAPATRLGIVLNLTGGRAEWETMNALVQEIVDDLDNGTTTYRFGPAGHLTIQDLMEHLRATRKRRQSGKIKERETGHPGNPPEVDGGQGGYHGGSATPPTAFRYPWIDYSDEQEDDDGNSVTWDALLGYGRSSFAGEDEIDHSGPLEKFELSVGNDNSGWTGPSHDASAVDNVLSIISGDDDPTNDCIWIGVAGGSVSINPSDPSIYLSENMDPSDDSGDDPYINISLVGLLIKIQDASGGYIDLDASGNPTLNIYDSTTEAMLSMDCYTLSMADGTGGTASVYPGGFSFQDAYGDYLNYVDNSIVIHDAAVNRTVTISPYAAGGNASFQSITYKDGSGTTQTRTFLVV